MVPPGDELPHTHTHTSSHARSALLRRTVLRTALLSGERRVSRGAEETKSLAS